MFTLGGGIVAIMCLFDFPIEQPKPNGKTGDGGVIWHPRGDVIGALPLGGWVSDCNMGAPASNSVPSACCDLDEELNSPAASRSLPFPVRLSPLALFLSVSRSPSQFPALPEALFQFATS